MTLSLAQCSLVVLLSLLLLHAASLIARLLGRPALPLGFPTPLGSQWDAASAVAAVALVQMPPGDRWDGAAVLAKPAPDRSPTGFEKAAAVLRRTNWV